MSFITKSKQAYARLIAGGVCARAVVLAVLAALFPMLALLYLSTSPHGPRALATLAFGVTLLCILALIRTLRPIALLAGMLEHYAKGQSTTDGLSTVDDHRRIMANFNAIAFQLETLSGRARKHPVTGLPMRDDLLMSVGRDVEIAGGAAVLGLIRLANYDHILAFDAAAAERVLVEAARRFTGAVKPGRSIAQVDRDCFAIWFGGVDPKVAAAELEAIGYVLMREIELSGTEITPDVQLGSALYPLDADEPANLLTRAFVSLARPQRTADGGIAFFAKPSAQEARRRFVLEQELRHAVRRGELTLAYQPFVDLAMGRVVGCEALLRWREGNGKFASPAHIVPVLEETGLVHEIGLWTLNAACRQLRAWRELGLDDIKVAVNISAQQLRDSALPSALKRTVAAHDLNCAQIELELTETAAMEDASRTLAMFEQLREAGFGLSIDDFGSGYSSLSYLRRLPFQKLKIDREFVTQVDKRADSRTICKALIDLTAGLELAVLAEGVERFEEVETLRTLGCFTFQGYYFARPLEADDFVSTVTNTDWLARACSRVRREQEELRRRLS